MKQIKQYTLGILSVVLLTVTFYACSGEGISTAETNEVIFNTKSNGVTQTDTIAVVRNGVPDPLYDVTQAKLDLVASGIYTDVESIELAYGLNPDTNQYEAIIVLIGTEAATGREIGIVGDLVVDGDQLILPDPVTEDQAYAKHSCTPDNCSWCKFDRSWFLGEIRGCECKRAADENKSKYCYHSINGGGLPAKVMAETLSKLLAGV